jgi:signal transduction histidine kinase
MLFSTRKDLVFLGIISPKMNKMVLENLQKNRAPELEIREAVAGTPYIAQYRPCLSASGDLLGFIGVPNPDSRVQIGTEVSNFIGMLASLYVFLLLIAYAVTYALSRSIIRPLSLLSEKVQELKFTDKNDPLVYAGDNQDEISELIARYNTMVAKLEDSKLQLVRLEREGAWREMARQVAHDIKNPLTTMKLSMQQLERVSSNPEQAAAYLRKAITRLIEQIDSLAQIASEFSMFANLDIRQKSDVVVNEVVENVHDLFSEQRNVHLDLSMPKEALHIMGDKNHLIRVFNNLVINAIQAIPSDREGRINVAVLNQNGLAVIKISDNGGGIPPEIRDRVFEPNFTTKTSGSGLGLAICKKIIEAHDGNIRFETRENEGTDFFVEIPVSSVA